jgi:hypothetical protein
MFPPAWKSELDEFDEHMVFNMTPDSTMRRSFWFYLQSLGMTSLARFMSLWFLEGDFSSMCSIIYHIINFPNSKNIIY